MTRRRHGGDRQLIREQPFETAADVLA